MYIVKGLRFIGTLDVVFLESFKMEVIFKSVRRNKQLSLKICEIIFQWHINICYKGICHGDYLFTMSYFSFK